LRRELDHGEAETIALALQLGLNTVSIDEHAGRAAARTMGPTPIGILGVVLLRAKLSGHIASLESLLTALQRETGFYIAANLILAILREAKEQ
jgi:uncharacterized protein